VVPNFEQVDIGLLREYLQWEFQEYVGEWVVTTSSGVGTHL
jgi:hypothetical protein